MRRVPCPLLEHPVLLPGRPRRVVSFVSGLTEAIWAMNLEDRVVGVSHYCARYVETGGRPVTGDYLRIDEVALKALAPDLVLMTGGIQHGVTRRLAKAGLPVYALPLPDSFHGILENIRRLGALLGEMEAACALTARMEAEAADLRSRVPARRPMVCAELWFGRHPRVTGGPHLHPDLSVIAGG